MRNISLWIASKFIKDHHNTKNFEIRSQYGILEGWVSIVFNSLLFIIKLTAGIYVKSIALIADAVHTLSDSVTSAIIILGFNLAKKPSDEEHPFGHGRMEFVVTLIVSVLLFVVGADLIEKSVGNIANPVVNKVPITVIMIVFLTMIIKELMARFSLVLSKIIESPALEADALHHRSDVISTAIVIIGLIGSRFGISRLDGFMGILVSLTIFYSAYKIAKDAISPILGEAPPKNLIENIEKIALSFPDVSGIHDVIYHNYVNTTIISLHIEVSDKESVTKLHNIAERIEEKIGDFTGGQIVIHIDPINKDHPQYAVIEDTIKNIIIKDPRIHSFHELRIVGCSKTKCNVLFDIALMGHINDKDSSNIIRSIKRKFKKRFPGMKTIIKAEPKYSYNL